MAESFLIVVGGPRIGRSASVSPGQRVHLGNFRTPENQLLACPPLIVSLTRSDLVSTFADQAFAGAVDADVYATIEYGAGAESERVDVDYLAGTTLAIPGNFVNVIATYPPLDQVSSDKIVEPWNVQLGCMVGVGEKSPTGTAAAARRTLRTPNVPTGTGRSIPIPIRALDVTVLASHGSGNAVSGTVLSFSTNHVDAAGVLFFGRPGTDLATVRAGGPAAAAESFRVLIPNSARSLLIFNDFGGGTRYVAVFSLSI
jgi:hypothetical protein